MHKHAFDCVRVCLEPVRQAFLFEVMTMEREIKEQMQLSEKEEKLIHLIRDLKFGELRLFVADSQPVRLEEVKKSIKL